MRIDTVITSGVPSISEQKLATEAGAVGVENENSEKNILPSRLIKAVDDLNNVAETLNRAVRFAIYDGTHRIVVQVVDKQTNEVVATFPPKQILKMAATFNQDCLEAQKDAISKEVE